MGSPVTNPFSISLRRGIGVAQRRVAPAAAATRFEHQHITGVNDEANFLCLDRAQRLPIRIKRIAMWHTVDAAEDAAGAVTHAVAGGVADRRFGGLDDHLHDPAGTAAVFAGATGIGAEFVAAEEQREAHLGDFEAAELDAARRLPLARTGPAVTRR